MHGKARVVLTNTHVIALHPPPDLSTPYIIQAFTVPDDWHPVENGMGVLHLSHEGAFSSRRTVFAIIRNSVVDPMTGVISIKLLERHWRYDDFPSTCINLTLQPSSVDVSPILVDQHPIVVEGGNPHSDRLRFCSIHYDICDDGYARGSLAPSCCCGSPDSRFGVMKFSIDATQDRCVAVLGGLSCADECHDILPSVCHTSFDDMVVDCVRGRLSFIEKDTRSCNRDFKKNTLVVVGIE